MSANSNMINNIYGHESDDMKTENLGQDSAKAAHEAHYDTDRAKIKHPRSSEGEHQNDPSFQFPRLAIPVVNQARDGKAENKDEDLPAANHLNSEDALSEDGMKEIRDLRGKAFEGHDPNSMIRVGACREMETQAALSADEVEESPGMQTKALRGQDTDSVIRIGACRGMVRMLQDMEMKRENQEMKDKLICKMCRVRMADITFIPCGHLVCCSDCDKNIVQCVSCKTKIEKHIPTRDEEQ